MRCVVVQKLFFLTLQCESGFLGLYEMTYNFRCIMHESRIIFVSNTKWFFKNLMKYFKSMCSEKDFIHIRVQINFPCRL